MTERRWPLTPDEEDKTTLEDLKFVFSQSEKALIDLIQIGDQVVSRSYNLITLISGVASVFAGFCINKTDKSDALFMCSVLGFLYALTILFFLYKVIKGHKYKSVGSAPRNLLDKKFYSEYYDSKRDERIKNLYITEINSYQNRIQDNELQNDKRWHNFDSAIKMIILLPILLMALYAILTTLLASLHS